MLKRALPIWVPVIVLLSFSGALLWYGSHARDARWMTTGVRWFFIGLAALQFFLATRCLVVKPRRPFIALGSSLVGLLVLSMVYFGFLSGHERPEFDQDWYYYLVAGVLAGLYWLDKKQQERMNHS